jgi:hypothetical protein
MVLGECGIGIRPPSRAPLSSFEGAARRPYESGRHSATELTLALRTVPYNGGDGLTRRVGGTSPGYDSQARQRVDVCGFACRCQSIKCPG